jgi:serine protease
MARGGFEPNVFRHGSVCIIMIALMAAPLAASAQQELNPRIAPPKPTLQQLQSIRAENRVTVKFREGSGFRIQNGQFTSQDASEISPLLKTLDDLGIPPTRIRPLFSSPPQQLDAERLEGQRQSGKQLADLNLYYVIDVPEGANPAAVASALNGLSVVEFAEPRRKPSPAPQATPDFTSRQGYKNEAPQGIGAPREGEVRGSDGAGLRAVDLEYSWRLDHEDLNLPPDRRHVIQGCAAQDPFNDTNHGTAVLGEVGATKNAFGVTGVVPAAQLHVAPTDCTDDTGGYSLEKAILTAASILTPGEVIIIEQQAQACGGACGADQVGCGPVEDEQSVFDVIRNVTSRGIIVVEAAGNGRVDLDGAQCQGKFNRTVRDSGAIMVGAGSATNHARLDFSDFGSRVDVQGWGHQVATTGYGDAFGQGEEQRRYTNRFGGTSSATPIVSSAVLAINGVRKACKAPLARPLEMRALLAATGTPQGDPAGGHIGPLPNIRAALAAMPDLAPCLRPSPFASLAGQWMIGDSGEILNISGDGRWLHPSRGAARIRAAEDGADFKVFYEAGATQCSYRFAFADGGNTLALMTADRTQDGDYCPEGSLKRMGQ